MVMMISTMSWSTSAMRMAMTAMLAMVMIAMMTTTSMFQEVQISCCNEDGCNGRPKPRWRKDPPPIWPHYHLIYRHYHHYHYHYHKLLQCFSTRSSKARSSGTTFHNSSLLKQSIVLASISLMLRSWKRPCCWCLDAKRRFLCKDDRSNLLENFHHSLAQISRQKKVFW